MTRSILDEIAGWANEHLWSFVGPVLDYIWLLQWYTLGGVLLLVALVIGYFLPFPWVRATLGFLLLLYGAYNAGIQVAWNHLRKEHAPPPPPPPKQDRW